MASCDTILEEDRDHELKVTFHPPLYLQRKIWILDVMRREGVVDIVDIGCGEGQLLIALSQPAPWLGPPPSDIVPPPPPSEPETPLSPSIPNFNSEDDSIPNLHPTKIAGLDISERDLQFAVEYTAPPPPTHSPYMCNAYRWEPLTATIWKGGLQVINEAFVNTECIVSSEVIEHLPPDVFPFYAPVLLGVYHPFKFLVTTPSYTFNARFTSPNAHSSVRNGFPDPTGRTNRIFRHHDHKFEWTISEFEEWCTSSARRWGYNVKMSDVGRPIEEDEWERDDELGGASLVAEFTRLNVGEQRRAELEEEARRHVKELGSEAGPHEKLVVHEHPAHPNARKPATFEEIGECVKDLMESSRERFMRFEEVWYERDVSVLCGGWTEVLARAVEMHERLDLIHDEGAMSKDRDAWTIELVGGPSEPRMLWPTTEDMGDESFEYMPADWIPEEEPYSDSGSELGEGDSHEWGGSTGPSEGDTSWNTDVGDDGEYSWSKTDGEGDGWGKYNGWGAILPEDGSAIADSDVRV